MAISLHNRFTRFIVVGCSNTVISYAVFALLFYSDLFPLTLRTPVSQSIGYSTGIVWSFILNRHWAFRRAHGRERPMWNESGRFIVLQAGCLIFSAAAMTLLIEHLAINPEIAWLSTMAVVTILNFAGMYYWVFPAQQHKAGH